MATMQYIDGIAALKTLEPTENNQVVFLTSHQAGSHHGGGEFYYDPADTTSSDNNGTIIVTTGGARWKRLSSKVTFDDFGADPSGATSADVAIGRAITFVSTQKSKIVYASENARYLLNGSQPINVPAGVTVKGNRAAMAQGPSSDVSQGSARANLSDDSAFIIRKPVGIICFSCERDVVFDGWSFLYPDQNYAASSSSQFIKYGATISSKGTLSVAHCRYVGAFDFVDALGEANYFDSIYGWAVRCDYHLSNSREINRFTNVHVNPNVERPRPEAVAASITIEGSCAFNLDRHDNTFLSNVFAFGKGIFIKTKTEGTSYLGGISLSNFMADRCSTCIDIDSDSSANIQIANGSYINDYSNADSGFMILRKSLTRNNITPVQLTNVSFSTANNPNGVLAPQAIRFDVDSGYQLNFNNTVMPLWQNGRLNNAPGYNILRGEVTLAQRAFRLTATPHNYLTNASMINIDANKMPLDWLIDGNLTAEGNQLTATGENAAYKGIMQRIQRPLGPRTFWVVASYIGDPNVVTPPDSPIPSVSTGIWARSYNDGYTDLVESQTVSWVRIGSLYYAQYFMNNTRTIHDILINPGSNGNVVKVIASGISPGQLFDFSSLALF
ncbi:exopolysaccharide biosynthesis protein [Serratia sp. AKBS12]|uniref:exopolysaccharide biosynthesis protein n=1 Tax=Serratia sp. AKBS12 TaxID=2974597 RepID=UPI0021653DDC|nr:exopolysaccharide biosynthesis protein [Serratia sp. AKBS12]MCS3408407.1 exopolysaccharide biosynthesis protein [Serratia sp. AKBS12]